MSLDQLLNKPQYSIPQPEKAELLGAELRRLTVHHRERSAEYRRLTDILFDGGECGPRLSGLPYLPVGLFKERLLASVPQAEIFKILQSSGTTGQVPSRVVLDRETAQLLTLALSRIMTHVLGPNRLPMMLIDFEGLLRDRRQFNARAAGVLGMMNFGRNHLYVLDENLELRREAVVKFLAQYGSAPFLMFGFTYLVWASFYEQMEGAGFDLSNGILIHSGGWKKLQDKAVDGAEFRRRFKASTGLTRSYNFYGLAEQVGSVCLEADDGWLYPPNFADVIIRDPITLAELPPGQPGVVEVLSALPRSYPGHALLTEDLGVVHAIDPETGDRKGKAFSILGRIKKAELRGCSDVIASRLSR